MLIDRILTLLIIAFFMVAIVISHVDLDKRLKVLESQRQEKVEKEKDIIGYWTINQDTHQLEYEAKL